MQGCKIIDRMYNVFRTYSLNVFFMINFYGVRRLLNKSYFYNHLYMRVRAYYLHNIDFVPMQIKAQR